MAPTPTNGLALVCRAVDLSSVDPSAAKTIAYTVEGELRGSPFFDAAGTALLGSITPDETTRTITFGINVGLTNVPNLNQ